MAKNKVKKEREKEGKERRRGEREGGRKKERKFKKKQGYICLQGTRLVLVCVRHSAMSNFL